MWLFFLWCNSCSSVKRYRSFLVSQLWWAWPISIFLEIIAFSTWSWYLLGLPVAFWVNYWGRVSGWRSWARLGLPQIVICFCRWLCWCFFLLFLYSQGFGCPSRCRLFPVGLERRYFGVLFSGSSTKSKILYVDGQAFRYDSEMICWT